MPPKEPRTAPEAPPAAAKGPAVPKAPAEAKPAEKAPVAKAIKKPEGAGEDFRYIVRLANTDLRGDRSVVYALTGIKGIGVRAAEVVADLAGVSRYEPIGNLKKAQTDKIMEILTNLGDLVPPWFVNRPREWSTGADTHVFGSDVDLVLRDDINRMKMIRSYKGVRHEQGQKVRGQRTGSNGRTGLTVGVIKKTAIAAAKAAEKEESESKRKKE